MFTISLWNDASLQASQFYSSLLIRGKIKSNFTYATSFIRALATSMHCIYEVVFVWQVFMPCWYLGKVTFYCCCSLTLVNTTIVAIAATLYARHDRHCHFCCTGVFIAVVTIASLISSTTASSLLGWQQQCRRFSQRFLLLPITCVVPSVFVWTESVFSFFFLNLIFFHA